MIKNVFFLFVLVPFFSISQERSSQNEKTVYSGFIIDQDTKQPVPFATIFIKEQGVYRFGQEDGSFEIAVKLRPESTIIFSAMGYSAVSLSLKNMDKTIKLKPQIEELSEVVVIAEKRITPQEVIKNAIKQKKNNYPVKPFNQKRYTRVTVAELDANTLDLEVINDEYHEGYHKLLAASKKVEQVKWNKGNFETSVFKTVFDINGEGRPDQVQYAPFLRRGKYKDFKYQFVNTNELTDNTQYVIDYRPPNYKWKNTHFDHSIYHSRAKIQSFRGRIFIRKIDYKILKVEEEWLAINEPMINDLIGAGFKENSKSDSLWIPTKRTMVYDVKDYKVSTKEVFEYEMEKDGLNYPSSFFKLQKIEFTDAKGEQYNGNVTSKSIYLDAHTTNVTKYPYEGFYFAKKYSLLNRVDYDPIFWEQFLKNNPDL